MSTRNDDWRNREVAVLVGPSELLAQHMIQRIRQIFLAAGDYVLGGSKNEVTINRCVFRTTPSNHLDALRSKSDLVCIICDELDYYKQDADILRECVERYVPKTNPWIIACSTPDPVNSLMYQMEHEHPSIYSKLALTWEDCREMYSLEDIATARRSPSWNREMMAECGGFQSNVFSNVSIERAIVAGRTVDLDNIIPSSFKVLAVDQGLKTGVTLGQYANRRCEILYSCEWPMTDITELIERIIELADQYGNCKVFVDSSMPLLTGSLAKYYGDPPNLLERINEMKKDGRPASQIVNRFTIIPIVFSTEHNCDKPFKHQ